MEKYYKNIDGGYLVSISTGSGHEEITQEEYNQILEVICSRPTAEAGYGYRLKTDLTWELYELPPVEEADEEATIEDYAAALRDMGVEV